VRESVKAADELKKRLDKRAQEALSALDRQRVTQAIANASKAQLEAWASHAQPVRPRI
jgi:predicted transcriptional regulator